MTAPDAPYTDAELQALLRAAEADPPAKRSGFYTTQARLVREVMQARAALRAINRRLSPGNRTFDEMIHEVDVSCALARAALPPGSSNA